MRTVESTGTNLVPTCTNILKFFTLLRLRNYFYGSKTDFCNHFGSEYGFSPGLESKIRPLIPSQPCNMTSLMQCEINYNLYHEVYNCPEWRALFIKARSVYIILYQNPACPNGSGSDTARSGPKPEIYTKRILCPDASETKGVYKLVVPLRMSWPSSVDTKLFSTTPPPPPRRRIRPSLLPYNLPWWYHKGFQLSIHYLVKIIDISICEKCAFFYPSIFLHPFLINRPSGFFS